MKNIKLLIALAMVSAGLFSCTGKNEIPATAAAEGDSGKPISKVVGIARVEPEKGLLYLYAGANGKIAGIYSLENEEVKEGSVLASLEDASEAAQLQMEKSKIAAQQTAIAAAEANAKITFDELRKSKEDLALNEQLFKAKAITEQVLNDSRAKAIKLANEYEKQLAEIGNVKNKMPELQATIQYKKILLDDKQIKAEYDGKVLKWDVHKGDYITGGQKLGQFAPAGPLVAVTEVDELFAGKIKTGMKAKIISQLDGSEIGEGEVYFVGGYLKKKSLFSDENTVEDRRVREVKIRIHEGSAAVINSRVDCVIYVK